MKHTPDSLVESICGMHEEMGRAPSLREFTAATGVSSSTMARHGGWAALRDRALGARTERDELLAREHRARVKERSTRNELGAIVRDLERRVDELSEANDFLLGVTELVEEWTPHPIKAKPAKRGALPEATYVAMASDWHVGERVRPEQVGHQNEYNPDIARERGAQFWRSNRTMLNAARAAWRIPKLLLWLGGDLITGYIHEEYEAENFLSPTEETMLAFEMVVEGIDFLLASADLEEILVVTSNGNHGRTERKKRVTGDYRNSYEFMLYQLIAIHYKNDSRVKFQIGTGYYNIADVYGFKIRFSHGDAVRSSGGVGGLAPPLYRRLGKLGPAGIDVMGHHHQLDFLRKFARNGSLIGWNHFAEYMGCEFEPPQQGSFVVDSKHQMACNFNPIIVDPKRR